jgi:hypothetical protein
MERTLLFALLTLVCGLPACSSQKSGPNATVTLRDGSTMTGAVTESSAQEIKIVGSDGSSHTIPMTQVKAIEYDEPAAPANAGEPEKTASTGAPAASGKPSAKAKPHTEHYHPAESVISTKTYVVPAGAELSVRVEETIDSKTAAEGQTYAAEITKDVLDADGNVVIPDGSNGQIVIRSASKGGRFRGQSDLVLDLQSVSVGGRRYMVDTSDVEKKGRDGVGANKRTAIFTGTGAAVGAIIGAIAGGGKGAAIGAASGAGAGALTQIVTKGSAIKVPAETVLTFKLDAPLRVAAK